MDHYSKVSALKKNAIVKGLSEDQLDLLASLVAVVSLSTGDYLFKEGDLGEPFFIIAEGEIEILKEDASCGTNIHLANLEPGDILGEMASMGDCTRAASARVLTPCTVLEVSLKKLSSIPHAHDIYDLLRSKLPSLLIQRIKTDNVMVTNAIRKQLEHETARASLGTFLIYCLVAVFIYIYALQTITLLDIRIISSTIISIPTLIVFATFMLLLMKKSNRPWSAYGFSLHDWGKHLLESFFWTAPILGGVIALKWVMIQFDPAFYGRPLFHISADLNFAQARFDPWLFSVFVIAYVIFVPVQEMIYRGAMQTTFEHLLLTKHRTRTAILISNLPFSLIHLHISFSFTILVYFLGVFWGWMFAKQKTLIGCTFSHLLTGFFGFFIIGL